MANHLMVICQDSQEGVGSQGGRSLQRSPTRRRESEGVSTTECESLMFRLAEDWTIPSVGLGCLERVVMSGQ